MKNGCKIKILFKNILKKMHLNYKIKHLKTLKFLKWRCWTLDVYRFLRSNLQNSHPFLLRA